jgi:exopolysaccharide biosynthesis polyprenyl glycosylphosphotransferase
VTDDQHGDRGTTAARRGLDELDAAAEALAAARISGPARVRRRLGGGRRISRMQRVVRAGYGISEGSAPVEVAADDAMRRRLLAAADVIAVGLTLTVAVTVLGDESLTAASLALLPLVVLVSAALGLYDRDEVVLAKSTLAEVPKLFEIATLFALLAYVGQHVLTDTGHLGAEQGIVLWLGFFTAIVACRSAMRRLTMRAGVRERCLVLGDPEAADAIRRRLACDPLACAEVAASIAPATLPGGPEAVAAVASVVRAEHIHRIVVAAPELDDDDLLALVRDMKALGVKVTLQPRLLEVVGTAVEFDDIHGAAFLGVRRFGLTRRQLRMKRALDLVGATAGLLATAPLMAAIAIAIRLDSGGPAVFRQLRVGRDGRKFWIYKFRTMVAGADEEKGALREANEARGGLFKIRDDPRVTRVGRWLRRTSLDELPQLVNVLRGEMSLVGPRPLVVEEDRRIEGWHRRRLHLTPGMTGVWQVLGSARLPLHEMVALDYLYIVNWTLWQDVLILLRTVGFVLRRRGL